MSGTAMQILRLNERARNFSAPTTFGDNCLADCHSKWPILISCSVDSISIRTSELIGLVKTDLAIL